MGKTPRPLYIVVGDPVQDWEEIETLDGQGHTIRRLGDSSVEWDRVDIILDKRSWRMNESLRRYLPLAIKAARARRYGKDSDDSSSV